MSARGKRPWENPDRNPLAALDATLGRLERVAYVHRVSTSERADLIRRAWRLNASEDDLAQALRTTPRGVRRALEHLGLTNDDHGALRP